MKEYKFLVTFTEGCDEYWEDLEKLSMPDRIESLRMCIEEELYPFDPVVENLTVYQADLTLDG
jgi:hypothetical protein